MSGDSTHCYCEPHPEVIKRLLNAAQLSQLIHAFFQVNNHQSPINIVLAVCFGARTSDYKVNHILEYHKINFKKTLAGEICEYISRNNYQFNLVAYTGAVKFSSKNGNLGCQTEDQFKLDVHIKELEEDLRKLSNELQEQIDIYMKNFGTDILKRYIDEKQYLADQTYLGGLLTKFDKLPVRITELSKLTASFLEDDRLSWKHKSCNII